MLEGKRALVLGGSRGIGAAIVARFCKEGAEVDFTYFGSASEATALAETRGATAHKCDSGDRHALAALIGDLDALDILVVSAGVAYAGNPLKQSPEDVDRMIDINVRGPYHAAVAAARTMHDNGRIIFLGSVNGDRIPAPGGAAYAMTKSALQGAAQGLARDFGKRGIAVTNVQPGPVDTAMNPADGDFAKAVNALQAIRRHATPDEIAGLVAYLASDAAAMVTGTSITIDGGLAA